MTFSRVDLIFLSGGIILAAAGLYYLSPWDTSPVGKSVPAQVSREAAGAATHPILVPQIEILPETIKPKLSLPPAIVSDRKKQVISTARVGVDDRAHTVTTVIDTVTGQAQAFDRAEPLPWIEVSHRREFVAGIGKSWQGETALNLAASQEWLRVKAVRISTQEQAIVMPSQTLAFVWINISF